MFTREPRRQLTLLSPLGHSARPSKAGQGLLWASSVVEAQGPATASSGCQSLACTQMSWGRSGGGLGPRQQLRGEHQPRPTSQASQSPPLVEAAAAGRSAKGPVPLTARVQGPHQGDSAPPGTLAASGDTFGGPQQQAGEALLAPGGQRPGMQLNIPLATSSGSDLTCPAHTRLVGCC